MNLNFFLRGLVLGFSIAAPVGPIGVLCIRRTLADGRAVGLASGLGAATADALVPDPEDSTAPDESAKPKRRGWWSLGR